MKRFTSKVEVSGGEPLGGSDPSRVSLNPCDELEANGITFRAKDGRLFCLCSLDALYAGRLVDRFKSDEAIHIFAASHTHNAPMLDCGKPLIGTFSQTGCDAYVKALLQAKNHEVEPTLCRIYKIEVDIPVYRRFDYPDSILNRFLTSRFGFYPNEAKQIDRSIYLFEFADEEQTHFVFVYHACHPVTQAGRSELSPDYVGVIRQTVRERFTVETVIFFQGCAGDIRPNVSKKRISWLPKSRLNWKFNHFVTEHIVDQINDKYTRAIRQAHKCNTIALNRHSIDASVQRLRLKGGLEVETFRIEMPNGFEFHYLPFEVSHLYHLEALYTGGTKLIVSCTNETLGYLSHPMQHRAGGYEVDGSLYYMDQKDRLELEDLI